MGTNLAFIDQSRSDGKVSLEHVGQSGILLLKRFSLWGKAITRYDGYLKSVAQSQN